MQLFGILLVLNRKSRLGRQHSRTSGASRVRGAVQWPFKSRYCLTCSMSGDRWRWGGSDDRRIRKEGKKVREKHLTFFFQYIKPSSINHRLLPSPNLSVFRRTCVPTATRAHDVWQESLWSVLRNASDYKLTNKSSSTPMQCTLYIQSPSPNYTLLNRAFEIQRCILVGWPWCRRNHKVSIMLRNS